MRILGCLKTIRVDYRPYSLLYESPIICFKYIGNNLNWTFVCNHLGYNNKIHNPNTYFNVVHMLRKVLVTYFLDQSVVENIERSITNDEDFSPLKHDGLWLWVKTNALAYGNKSDLTQPLSDTIEQYPIGTATLTHYYDKLRIMVKLFEMNASYDKDITTILSTILIRVQQKLERETSRNTYFLTKT